VRSDGPQVAVFAADGTVISHASNWDAIFGDRLEVLGGDIARAAKIAVNPSDAVREASKCSPSAFSKKQ